jgi:RNA polymerase sigma factor for flagellar operon FliA
MLPLVKRMAFKMRARLPAHIDVDDLVGEGMVGLVDAVGKFNAAKRVKLASYARHRIRGAMLDGLRALDPASRELRRKGKRVERICRELQVSLGRPLGDEEISQALGVSLEDWHHILHELQRVGVDGGTRRLSASGVILRPAGDDDLPAAEHEGPFDLCYRREQRDILDHALACLSPRERLIMTLYYRQSLTMKQIAERLNVNESRVSQLHSAALRRLKTQVQALLHPSLPALGLESQAS